MVLRWLIWQLLVAVVVAMQEPPPNALNVVLVLADAWRYSAFGGADEPDALALTPRLDAFRKNSVDFQRAYAAYPLCTPSRISIQCGLLVTSHNVTKNGAPLSTSTPTLASTFSALGYHTAFFGKWHVGGDGYGSGNAMKLLSQAHRHGYSYWEQGVSQPGNGYGDYRHPVLLTTEGNVAGKTGQWEPEFYTDRALKWLKTTAAKNGKAEDEPTESGTPRPFLLTLCWRPPHGPWGLESKAALDAVMSRYSALLKAGAEPGGTAHKLRNNMPLRRWEKPTGKDGLLSMMKGYYAAGQELDKEFGRVLDCLSKLPNGIDERTVVVFGSDHGEMLESHEMTGKGQWYDESARVPLLVRLPASLTRGGTAGSSGNSGRKFRSAASLTDLYPTLIGLATHGPATGALGEYFGDRQKTVTFGHEAGVNGDSRGVATVRGRRLDGRDLSIDLLACYSGHGGQGTATGSCGTNVYAPYTPKSVPESNPSTPSSSSRNLQAHERRFLYPKVHEEGLVEKLEELFKNINHRSNRSTYAYDEMRSRNRRSTNDIGREKEQEYEQQEVQRELQPHTQKREESSSGMLGVQEAAISDSSRSGYTNGSFSDGQHRHHRHRQLRSSSRAGSSSSGSGGGRIVFSGMPGFWRMATTGVLKVVAAGKTCQPCEERLFLDLMHDPFEMRPRKYTAQSAAGQPWYDAEVERIGNALDWWCRTNRVDYVSEAARHSQRSCGNGVSSALEDVLSRGEHHKSKPSYQLGEGLAKSSSHGTTVKSKWKNGRKPRVVAVEFASSSSTERDLKDASSSDKQLASHQGKWAKGSEAQRNAPGGSRPAKSGRQQGDESASASKETPWWKKKLEKAKGQPPVVT